MCSDLVYMSELCKCVCACMHVCVSLSVQERDCVI